MKGSGGFGRALELMGNLAGAVWDGIKAVASSFVDDFRSIKASVEQLWLKLMAFLSNKWAAFLATIGPTFNNVAETLGTDARIDWFGTQSYASMLDHAVSNAGVMADRYRQRAQDTRAHAFDVVGPAAQALLARNKAIILQLARVTSADAADTLPKGSAQFVIGEAVAALPLGDVIDFVKERARLEKDLKKANEEIARFDAKLGNEQFVAKAPEEVLAEQREKRAEAAALALRLVEALTRLQP